MINAQITRNIPDRLHRCRAWFRFFLVLQNYNNYDGKGRIKINIRNKTTQKKYQNDKEKK
jgi:hypothetical protein